jgi:hypothetical protein
MLLKCAQIKSEYAVTERNVYSEAGRMCDRGEKLRELWLSFRFENFLSVQGPKG